MRVCTGLPVLRFALLPWPRTTSRTPDTLYLFVSFRSGGLLAADQPKTYGSVLRPAVLCSIFLQRREGPKILFAKVRESITQRIKTTLVE